MGRLAVSALSNPTDWEVSTTPGRLLCQYYRDSRGDQPMLSRARFDPADLRTILPRLFLLELHSPRDIRIRLCGTCLREKTGRELTGLNWLDLIAPEYRSARGASYAAMADARQGIRSLVQYPSTMGDDILVELVSLP